MQYLSCQRAVNPFDPTQKQKMEDDRSAALLMLQATRTQCICPDLTAVRNVEADLFNQYYLDTARVLYRSLPTGSDNANWMLVR